MKHPLIKVADIPAHGSTLVEFFGHQAHVYQKQGKPRAVVNLCLHFGGPLDYAESDGKFVCQWHNAQFNADNGGCVLGPAPSNSRLMFLSTRIEEDTLFYVWGE
jgi:nitrite reductase/ring-hydroxylating ferredoxin subunit